MFREARLYLHSSFEAVRGGVPVLGLVFAAEQDDAAFQRMIRDARFRPLAFAPDTPIQSGSIEGFWREIAKGEPRVSIMDAVGARLILVALAIWHRMAVCFSQRGR